MRIVFFVPWLTQGRGGTESIGSLIASGMAARGHSVFIYTFDDLWRESQWQLDGSIAIRRVPEARDDSSTLQTLLELQVDRPDLIVGLHMNREFFRYVYYAWRLDVPVVLSEHINPEYPRKIGRFGKREREIIFEGANRIHVLLPEFIETIPTHLRERAVSIGNTIHGEDLIQQRSERQKQVLTVARLVPRKQVDVLIDAFAKVADLYPEWNLVIAGYGEQEQELVRQASKLGVSEHVEFLGKTDQVYPLYESASIFVLPSETEGFGLTLTEAMAHGLPAVGFADCEGVNTQIVSGETGLLVGSEDKCGNLAGALSSLMGNVELRERTGAAGKLRYESLYSNRVVFDQWETFLREVCDERGHRLRSGDDLTPEERKLKAALEGGLDDYREELLG
ncbi:glycosyltransferase family 4 protein [Halioglobus maricola]|uniref:Glycosyltransferase family 4 protein n=1 Tax=Halioglobus maricola TaxID=2601894 RepID=A0A5P9NFB9_9GAMM|nr:glycosyltransferase [Halioglobus maricola]QFU74470.1 glycosyltransferase family 4 protein [Halioglobus maricola]